MNLDDIIDAVFSGLLLLVLSVTFVCFMALIIFVLGGVVSS